MQRFITVSIAAALMAGCAAPITDQIDGLAKASGCCVALANLPAAGSLENAIKAELSPASPIIDIEGKRSPALRYILPADATGKVLRIEASPSDPGLQEHGNQVLRFVPVAVVFLDPNGSPVASGDDSGLRGGRSTSWGSSFSAWRHVTIPGGAASAVFYSAPQLYNTRQALHYQFGGMVPAGGILIAMRGDANALYTVFGEFKAEVVLTALSPSATGK